MKKTIYFIIIFLMMGVFKIPSVYAETANVNDESEFTSALSANEVDVVKLNNSFVYNSTANINSANNSKTIDLNGYNISSNSIIEFKIYKSTNYSNFAFTITDSSTSKNGKITSPSSSSVVSIWVGNLTNKFTVKIDNGTYESSNTSSRFFFFGNETTAHKPGIDVIIKNTKVSGKYRLISTQGFNSSDININLSNLEYRKASSGTGIALVDKEKPFSSLFDSTKEDLYIDDVLYTSLDASASTVIANNSIIIKNKLQLTLDPVLMLDKEYGYTSTNAYDLSIKNNTSTSIELKSIILSNTSAFETVGSVTQTVPGNSSNNSLKIKAKKDLNAGTYSTSITVTDTNDNVYSFGEVTFKVTKATINPTITMNDWTYGDDPNEPSVTNNPSDGAVTYSYTDSSGTISNEKPTKPGEYTLNVKISEGTNHEEYTKTVDFIIYKKELIISNLTISDKNYNYSNPSLNVSQVTYDINVADVTYVRLVTPNSESDLNVGKGSARVFITIKGDYSQYYYFAGDNVIEVIEEAAYKILTTDITFYLTHSGSDNETNTTISVNKGTSLDLSSLFDLDETTLKNRVTYSLTGTPTGVSISGKNLVVENTSVTQTVGVQLTFPAYDIDGDGTNEINSKIKNIYIKITDKEVVTITGLDDNQEFTYDGSSKTPSGTITVQDNKVAVSELEVTYNGIDGTTYNNTIPPINAGKYTVTYKVSDSNPTYHGVITYNFTINKINPIYTVPTDLIGIKYDALDTIILPSGFVWKNSSEVMNVAGVNTFLVTYIPIDLDNYNQIENINVEVYVKGVYDVLTQSLGNGTLTSNIYNIVEGEKVEIKFTPDMGYVIEDVLVNGVSTLVTSNKLSIDVFENIEIKVSYTKELFSINVTPFDSNQINITPSGVTYVEYGDSKDIVVEIKDGYKLIFVKVNDVDKTTELVDNKLTLTNITSNYTIEVSVEKITVPTVPEEPEIEEPEEDQTPGNNNTDNGSKNSNNETDKKSYSVIEGSNQEIPVEGDKPASFKINADFKLFLSVYVDEKLLDPSNYEVSNGSTIVTLKESYLKTLAEGKYSLKVVFKDGGEAKTNFIITKDTEKEELPIDKTEPKKEEKESTNKVTYIILGIVILLAIMGVVILFKKYKETKE